MAQKMVLIRESELNNLKNDKKQEDTVIYKPGDVEINVMDTEPPKNASEEQILDLMPPRLKKRAQRILMHIRQFPEMVLVTEHGGLKINEQQVPGANLADILNELLVSIRKKKFEPAGIADFIRVLSMTHFPESGISNPKRRKQLQKYRRAMPNLKKKKKPISTTAKRYF